MIIISIIIRNEDLLSEILESNNYHVENTIEMILSMSGEEEKTPSSTQTSANSAPPPQPSSRLIITTTTYYFLFHLS